MHIHMELSILHTGLGMQVMQHHIFLRRPTLILCRSWTNYWRSGKTKITLSINIHRPCVWSQLYDHVKQGWMVICLLAAGMLTVCLCLAFCYVGADPLLSRLLRGVRNRKDNAGAARNIGT
jgi:hypothetical protein